MTVYGYVRASYHLPVDQQIELLVKKKCTNIIIETNSDKHGKELRALQAKVKKNDELVTTNINVLGMTTEEFESFLAGLIKRGICFSSVEEGVNTASVYSGSDVFKLIYNLKISGKARARYNDNVAIGRPRINQKTIDRILSLYNKDKKSMRFISEECDVSLGTVHKYINKQKK
ncbi:MAG: hypothetical protein ACTH54_00370 [Vagococcus salmoninarum]|uniref:hypothetical protein n=1 Tax=Vagococcus salmoninarum TaxID=2739 RepID=UPI003F9CC822